MGNNSSMEMKTMIPATPESSPPNMASFKKGIRTTAASNAPAGSATPEKNDEPHADYEFEPEEEEILRDLLPRNIATQIFRALMENSAGFYAAQMSAMDSATRNAGEMIDKLTLSYNRSRQAMITKELIEIISGAEAL